MKPDKLPAANDTQEKQKEVASLITTLHETGQRLEELTVGEVDTVADASGRPLLLPGAQEQWRQNEAAKQAAILEALPAHIALLDTHGVIISVNESWHRFGTVNAMQTPGCALGLDYLEICDRASLQDVSAAHETAAGIRAVLKAEIKAFSIEYSWGPPAAQRWFLLTATPMPEDRPHGAVIMYSDITACKEAENEIRRLNATLEQRVAERTTQLESVNRELETFSYSVSHDLRAPLRHIGAFAELLQENLGASLSVDNLKYLARISKGVKSMGELIADLLAFSYAGRADLRRTIIDCTELVGEIVEDLRAENSRRNIAWRVHAMEPMWGDRALLRMALMNLLANAVKYTSLRLAATIEIGSAVDLMGNPAIFVRDNGVGFDPKYAAKLFGVFQRLHSQTEFEGTGVGLANVQRIVHRHGGQVWADGVVDGGATFYFSLPQRRDAVDELPADEFAHQSTEKAERAAVENGWLCLPRTVAPH